MVIERTVRVTAGHLARGKRGSCSACAVALAVADAFPEACAVSMCAANLLVTLIRQTVLAATPRRAADAMRAFDAGYPVEPFEFLLRIAA
jgi:hypothetical protein